MSLYLHNTLSKKKEEFIPLQPKEVGIYACGITLYDDIHIGHLKSILSIEILKNLLEHQGVAVKLVRNITDIDDKIISRALKAGQSPMAYVQHYIDRYHKEHNDFGFSTNYEEPRVSEYLPQIFTFITDLMGKEVAYAANSTSARASQDIYFKVDKAQTTEGRYILSGKKPQEMQSSGRVANKDNKESAQDFALWKSDSEFGWASPWGQGRPGWHIECSVMHYHTLGAQFDIHAGGRDLVFPHHENEIHQSSAHNGVNPARYWFHNGVVKVKSVNEQGEVVEQKLSKSLGNSVYTKDLQKIYSVEAIKLFLNFARPSSDQFYEEEQLASAQKIMAKIYEKSAQINHNFEEGKLQVQLQTSASYQKIISALEDNLNTPEVVASLHALLQKNKWEHTDSYEAYVALNLLSVNKYGMSFTEFLDKAQQYTLAQVEKAQAIQSNIPLDILELAKKRWEAKETKDWAGADNYKKEIIAHGWQIEDNKEGWLLKKSETQPVKLKRL